MKTYLPSKGDDGTELSLRTFSFKQNVSDADTDLYLLLHFIATSHNLLQEDK